MNGFRGSLATALASPIEDVTLEVAGRYAPTVRKVIDRHGEVPLIKYLGQLSRGAHKPLQERDDLAHAVYLYVAPLLGESLAQRAAADILRFPVALTANHHGVDYFSQSVQSSLLFALSRMNRAPGPTTVPILACANIPLNNLTFPQGMLFYRATDDHLDGLPKKLPLFPSRLKRSVVSSVAPFDAAMVSRAKERLAAMLRNREVDGQSAQYAQELLDNEYGASAVLNCRSYSEQAVILNSRIWKRLFCAASNIPELISMELEGIVAHLLELDLLNPASLAWAVMFDPELRGYVLSELENQRACWSNNGLARRLAELPEKREPEASNRGCGTMFFWGIDDAGRKVPLYLDTSRSGEGRLVGRDDRGQLWQIPLTPLALHGQLKAARLIPSLFTCYLTVSLARGVTCMGGYYQAAYLPAIQRGLLKALGKTQRYQSFLDPIGKVPTDLYLSGMQAVLTEAAPGHLLPAGPLEIAAGGGLNRVDLDRIATLTVREAHVASLFETLPDVAPQEFTGSGWKRALAASCGARLKGRVVIK